MESSSPRPGAALLLRAVRLARRVGPERPAAASVKVKTKHAASFKPRALRWGGQLDIRPISADGELTDNAVAGYVAKYATKAAECTGTLDRRLTRADNPDTLAVTPHARRLIAECLRIGQVPDLEYLRTAEWAHMLGFRGHFSTKGRAYSTTLGALRAARAARAAHRREEHAGEFPNGDTVLVVNHWRFVGTGHLDDLVVDDSGGGRQLAVAPSRGQPGEGAA